MPNQASFTAATPGAVVQGTVTDKLPALPGTPPTGRTAIGPRITPNFITDPWSSDNTYQYYDVVLVEGNSYIARKAVPAGIQITNTEYWIHWADPNAQFQELQNTVQTFDGRITENATAIQNEVTRATQAETVNSNAIAKLNAKKVCVIIGDSFSNAAQSGTPLWYTNYCNVKNYTPYTNARDGAGYTIDGNTFLDQLNTANTAITDKSTVAEVIIFGGLNDTRSSSFNEDTFAQALSDTLDAAKSYFPNALIWVVGPQSFCNANPNSYNAIKWMSFRCVERSIKYSNPVFAFNWINGFFGGTTGENEHPSALGERIIASYMLNDGHISSIQSIQGIVPSTYQKLAVTTDQSDDPTVNGTVITSLGNIIDEHTFNYVIIIDATKIENTKNRINVKLPGITNPVLGINRSPNFTGHPYPMGHISQLYGNAISTGWLTDQGVSFNINNDTPITTGAGANQIIINIDIKI